MGQDMDLIFTFESQFFKKCKHNLLIIKKLKGTVKSYRTFDTSRFATM